MEKRLCRGLLASLLSFFLEDAGNFRPASKPVPARRSRTTERSESVSEEAEYLRLIFGTVRAIAAFFNTMQDRANAAK